jgi:hypothetical protein
VPEAACDRGEAIEKEEEMSLDLLRPDCPLGQVSQLPRDRARLTGRRQLRSIKGNLLLP